MGDDEREPSAALAAGGDPQVKRPRNGFSLNSDPMVKMCHACGSLHRDLRPDAAPADASLCAKCLATGIAEPARFVA